MTKKKQIEQRLKKLKTLIDETKQRLPAHSTKPPIMHELLELEDEYDMLQRTLKCHSDD